MHTSISISHGPKLSRQRGAVLFFALIALVVMTLAAVALIRSVDTNTLIAGNLAFKQSATSSGDAGTEAAITWLTANVATLDNSNVGAGYYNSLNQSLDLTGQNWAAISASAGTDSAGNTVRYVIQRLCNHPIAKAGSPNSEATIELNKTNCILGDPPNSGGDQSSRLRQEGCPDNLCGGTEGAPMYRITSQVTGPRPRNTVSYIQAFVY